MKAAVCNPYLDTLGGGELYTLSFARVLRDKGYRVDVQWKDARIAERLERRFGEKLEGMNVVDDIKRGDGYDVCFWVSDGSIPTLRARKNILHFQVPFTEVNGKTLLNKMKLFRINSIVCNSRFTKGFIDKEYGVESVVIYPPVNTEKFVPKRKTNTIVYVGRFSQLTQAKNQHILVDAFKKFYKKGFDDWRLVLVGGGEIASQDYLTKLKKSVGDYPIEILTSVDFNLLKKYYGEAKIFWSAAGMGNDERKEPGKMEHFGITLVEAMSAGCVGVAFEGGGHREIIKDGENGLLFQTTSQLVRKTVSLISTPKMLKSLSAKARLSSARFTLERFGRKVEDLL